ncbi:M23 family metallopeptidase [Sphingobium aromaticiconvertens]|uniref:M23 family metallopeptidase n=1 Tax=Sphingobium aromaticiconvertens TaxID=365341 RepID=UPI003AFAB78C
MPHSTKTVAAGLRARLVALFPAREILLHSGDKVRFVCLTPRVQMLVMGGVSAALLGCGALALSVASQSAAIARERAQLVQQGKAVASSADKVESYKNSVQTLARDLEARQDFMDDLYRTHFGAEGEADASALIGKDDVKGKDAGKADALARKISAAPDSGPLLKIEQRQRRFAALLTDAVERRTIKAAAAIRSFGLNPDMMARSASRAQGGPFVPWRGDDDALSSELKSLASALTRMEMLERGLVAIPSGKPTSAPMLSSSYGYRRDPFNGHAAFHAGLDFPGHTGQPILAAARGKVSFVGQRQGYGNVVEVDHGNGLMTRYAHLSGFGSRVGQSVARGDAIARMGSTGRSTGPHLHFEVRLNGDPINPRQFLEARQDVLQTQQVAKNRFADIGKRG